MCLVQKSTFINNNTLVIRLSCFYVITRNNIFIYLHFFHFSDIRKYENQSKNVTMEPNKDKA